MLIGLSGSREAFLGQVSVALRLRVAATDLIDRADLDEKKSSTRIKALMEHGYEYSCYSSVRT